MFNKLNIVRDCWWLMSSGNNYITDENNNFSSYNHGLYTSLNSNDSEYLKLHGSGTLQYFGRLESSNINVEEVHFGVRGAGDGLSKAELFINDISIGSVSGFAGSVVTQSGIFPLTHIQKDRILNGRISSNYDYFNVNFETVSGVEDVVTYDFPSPDLWFKSDTGVYSGTDGTGTVVDGGQVGSWVDQGPSGYIFYQETEIRRPVYMENVFNGKPGLRFYAASGSFLDHLDKILYSQSGTIYAVHEVALGYLNNKYILAERSGAEYYTGYYMGGNPNYDIRFIQRDGGGSVTTDTTNTFSTGQHITSIISDGAIHTIRADGSGCVIDGGGTGEWFGDTSIAENTTIGAIHSKSYSSGPYYAGYIAEILVYNYPLNSSEIFGVENYLYDRYNLGQYVGSASPGIRNIEVYYSGDPWTNYSSHPTVLSSYHYPNRIGFRYNSEWIDHNGNNASLSGANYVAVSSVSLDVDNTYIQQQYVSDYDIHWPYAEAVPNGGLSLYFDNIDLDPITQVTRAKLNLRMSLPHSGLADNALDSFEANLYNYRYKEQDHKEDLTDIAASILPLNSKYGYFAYAGGPIVGQSGFVTYSTDFDFLNPFLPSGEIDSVINRNIDIFNHSEIKLVGLPSGVQLSSAELYVEYIPNNFATLYIPGKVSRTVPSTYPDYQAVDSILYGHGNWHHRGNLLEHNIFDAFYDLSEGSGTIINPITVDWPGVYGECKNYSEIPTVPNWKNYYRNPIIIEGSDDYISCYRDAIYNLDSDNLYIDFSDRIVLGRTFTLYFMLYVDPNNPPDDYVIFFRRGSATTRSYVEFYGYLESNGSDLDIHFDIRDTNTIYRRLQNTVHNYGEPILVWITCDYDGVTNQTTCTLNTHCDASYYYSSDWETDSTTFSGSRRQIGSVVNTIGPKLYQNPLDKTALIEFGWNGSEAITKYDIDDTDYATSTEDFKKFFSTRVCNARFLNSGVNPSGVNWVVPNGSGFATWTTPYSINEFLSSGNLYELLNPVTTAGTNYVSHSGAIIFDLDAYVNTNHPSGLKVKLDVEFDSGSTDKWKYFRSEFFLPSGEHKGQHSFTYHIGMNNGPIKYSDVDLATLNLTTEFIDIGSEKYYGNVRINSVNVFFDSTCVAATGLSYLDLYTHGSPATPSDSIDLFTDGKVTSNNNIDLYVNGRASIGSGDITLFIEADHYGLPIENGDITPYTLPLYIWSRPWNATSGDFPLFVWGTDYPALRNHFTLYTKSWSDPRYQLPLYIKAPVGEETSSLNLYIKNYPWVEIDSNISLYISGPSGIFGLYGPYYLDLGDGLLDLGDADWDLLELGPQYENVVNLYVRGLGTSDGYIPANSRMNLFMARNSEAVAERITLYMAQHDVTNNLDSYILGHQVANSSINLYIHGSGLPINNNIELYTHGF